MDERPRILHVVAAGEIGGAERMLVDLAQSPSERHELALFTGNPALHAFFIEHGLEVHSRGPVPEHLLRYLRLSLGGDDRDWLAQLTRRRDAQLLHVHTVASQTLGTRTARALGLPLLRTEHSTRAFTDPSCLPFTAWNSRHADRSVAISEHVRAVAEARAPALRGRCVVVANGVDTEHFAAAALPASQGPLQLGAVGRLDRRKGLDRALRVLAEVEGVQLHVIGEGEEGPALHRQRDALGLRERVFFHGAQRDVRPFVARCHAVVCAAHTEGLGIALLEAMSMQRPLLAVPVGGVVEFASADNAWLAARNDEAALTEALRSLEAERHDLARRGRAARATVLAGYSLDAMRAGYSRQYRALLAR